MKVQLRELMEESPIIAAIRDDAGLEEVLTLDLDVIFVLYGDLCTIPEIVRRCKEHGKIVFVHLDLISGLALREAAVDFIYQFTQADGIISTKPALMKRARELGLASVLRFFVLDSMAFETISKQLAAGRPDFLEILPGQMPKVIKKIRSQAGIPIIAGGLISDREDVMAALDAGAIAISSTNTGVWKL